MEAGKRRRTGDTARAANADEVKKLRRESREVKEVVAEQTLDLALQASGCDQIHVVHRPRLLSDNGSSHVSGELAE